MASWLVVAQLALLAIAYLPGVSEPAQGALLLTSLWFFGAYLGARLAGRYSRL